jgi:hypothetical protein
MSTDVEPVMERWRGALRNEAERAAGSPGAIPSRRSRGRRGSPHCPGVRSGRRPGRSSSPLSRSAHGCHRPGKPRHFRRSLPRKSASGEAPSGEDHCRAGQGVSHPLWSRFREPGSQAAFRPGSGWTLGRTDLVGVRGFEPPTSASRRTEKRSTVRCQCREARFIASRRPRFYPFPPVAWNLHPRDSTPRDGGRSLSCDHRGCSATHPLPESPGPNQERT